MMMDGCCYDVNVECDFGQAVGIYFKSWVLSKMAGARPRKISSLTVFNTTEIYGQKLKHNEKRTDRPWTDNTDRPQKNYHRP